MSKVASALGGARFDGFASVSEIGPLGMITLRAKPDVKGLAAAVKAVTGTKLPAQRRVERRQDAQPVDRFRRSFGQRAWPGHRLAAAAIRAFHLGLHHLAPRQCLPDPGFCGFG